jgi:hypothetical protein
MENLLSNGAFLWWSAALLDGLLSLVRHDLGVFSSGAGGRRCEVMEMYASGFVEHQGGYFISREDALGVEGPIQRTREGGVNGSR